MAGREIKKGAMPLRRIAIPITSIRLCTVGESPKQTSRSEMSRNARRKDKRFIGSFDGTIVVFIF